MACPNCEMARIRQMIEDKQRKRALEEQKRIADMIAKKKEARMLEEQKINDDVAAAERVENPPGPDSNMAEPLVKAVYESPVIEIIEKPEIKTEEDVGQAHESNDVPTEDNVEASINQKSAQQQKPKTNYPKKKKKNNKK